jgi:hypothetical protein
VMARVCAFAEDSGLDWGEHAARHTEGDAT